MTDLDLDALEAVARAATPGPWHYDPEDGGIDRLEDDEGEIVVAGPVVGTIWPHGAPTRQLLLEANDAEHIAALDPPTVRALIARIREAEEAADGEAAAHNDTISAWREAVDKLREAEATIDAVRANLSNAPECDEHPDDGPITCGWKSDMIRVRAAIARHQDKRENGRPD